MKKLIASLGIAVTALLFTANVHATNIPVFPSCLNPSGEVTAQYNEGTHGIVGDAGEYHGRDTVYEIDADRVLQCFCPPEGNGIQTSWWKMSGLSEYEIEELKHQGWVYVPTGSVWGLKNEAYLAKNVSYSCLGNNYSNQTVSVSTSSPGSSSTSSPGSSSPGSSSGGSSSSGSSNSLGLASTGTLAQIYQTALAGILFIVGGFLIKKGSKQ